MVAETASTSPNGQARSPNSVSGGNHGSSSSKRNKPCQQCQKLKVKCERNPQGGPCQRCLSQNKECTYGDQPNKRRKKDPDERLDELEKTLASMRKSLEGTQPATVGVPTSTEAGFGSSFGHPLDMLARTAASSHSPDDRFTPGATNFNGITPPSHPAAVPRPLPRVATTNDIVTTWSTELSGIDPIERGWIDLNDAKAFFERFWKHMLPTLPIISLGSRPAFEKVRREEPILFLSIIAASASTLTAVDLYEKLHKEALSVITYNSVVEGQKTSELLQSLLLLTFWPMAPARFDQLKTYLHCHMCVGMAIDLALQRSPKEARNDKSRLFDEVDPCNRKENFTRPLEKERTWLAVFVSAIGFAVGMRRPHSLDWTPHHSYCCQVLKEGGHANDVRLVHIAELLKFCQDVSKTFCYDTRPKKLSDPSVYLTVKGYRQQLENWREQNPSLDEYVSIWYHHTNLFLHEVALHSFHNTEDLRPPFGFNVRVELSSSLSDPLVSAAHVDCISKVVYSAQKLLDHMFALHFRDDGESLIPNLPTVFFARSLYAWITLVRVAAVGTAVCDESSLRIEEYLERLGQVLDEAASIQHFHTAMKFSWILRILKQCYKHKRGIPPNFKSMELGPATPAMTQPTPANTSTLAEPELAPGASGSASTTTLPPLETEFLAELDLGGTQLGAGPGADGIDWDALVGDGDWLMNLSGWNDPLIDGQLPPDQQILQQQSLR